MLDRQVWNVLLIEHNPEDVAVFERALAREPRLPARLHVVAGVQEAVDSIQRAANAPPSLVLFNTRAPAVTDERVTAGLRNLRSVTGAPVLLFCAACESRQIESAYRNYAAACTIVPEDPQRFESMVRDALDYWLTRVLLPHPVDSKPSSRDEHDSPRFS